MNTDPYNMRAEELALADCSQGLEVRRVWSERELVFSFGGALVPGTPDGMFETWDGALTCVQVVRVPLVPGFDSREAQDTVAQTVLKKVVKSQRWLRATHVVPQDFVIFCWLPFAVPEAVAGHAEALMDRVRLLDHRFVLRLRVPAEPGSLFPARFACNHEVRKALSRTVSESDVTAYGSDEEETDDDEAYAWDITWFWDADLSEAADGAGGGLVEGDASDATVNGSVLLDIEEPEDKRRDTDDDGG